MQEFVQLLERKNLCFRNFYKLCEKFVEEIKKGDATNLELFQIQRQGLINVLEKIEADVMVYLQSHQENPALLDSLFTDEIKTQVQQLLREKDGLLNEIILIDTIILRDVDALKKDTIQKLHTIQTGRKTIQAYRSPLSQVESAVGPKLVDREA
jgi:hypothetical protein